jgi:hypothetical protein
MRITEKDVGRVARLRDGSFVTILRFNPNLEYAVVAATSHGELSYTLNGSYWDFLGDHPSDIVELLGPTKSFEEDIEEWSNSCVGEEELDDELDERFVTKVPSIESNAIRLLKQLKAQGIMQLTIVADLGDGKEGEIKVEVYGKN